MTGSNAKRGFTLLEMLVASLLLSMMVVALSMVFSSSASAWRIGRAGVSGLHKIRYRMSGGQLAADNALPYIYGRNNNKVGYVRSVWLEEGSLTDQDGKSASRGFDTKNVYGSSSGVDTTKPLDRIDAGNANGNSFNGYVVGVGSSGPDGIWGTPDDIATWPKDYGGGI